MADTDQLREALRLFEEWTPLSVEDVAKRIVALDDPELQLVLLGMLEADRSSQVRDHSLAEGIVGGVAADFRISMLERGWLPPVQPEDESLPERIGRWTIQRVLGRGGMGVVYEGEEDHPRRSAAIKVLHPWIASERLLERFHDEVQILSELRHPGFPVVYEAGVDEAGRHHVAMELVRGRPIDEAARPLGPDDRVALVERICRVVQVAHEAGIVHRDLKPSNVLIDERGEPRVLDFGLATTRAARAALKAGTLGYTSPEQLRGEPARPSADVYALGAIAWEVLTGQLPVSVTHRDFDRAACAKEQATLPSRDEVAPGVDRAVWTVVQMALDPIASARHPDAGALADDLAAARQDRPTRAMSGDRAAHVALALRRNRNRVVAVLAAMGAFLLLVGSVPLQRARAEQQRELTAREALDRIGDRVVGDPAGGREQLEVFAGLPEYQGTRAVAEAWLLAARLAAEMDDADGELDALAAAWMRADASQREEVGVALGETLKARSQWDDLARLAQNLDAGGVHSPEGARLVAWGRIAGGHEAPGLAEAMPEWETVVERLQRGRVTEHRGPEVRAGWWRGERSIQIRRPSEASYTVLAPTPDLDVLHVAGPGDVSLQGWLAVEGTDDAWVLASSGVWDVREREPRRVAPPSPIDLALRAAVLDHPAGGPVVYATTTYPNRRLLALTEAGAATVVSPAIDEVRSDVFGIAVRDLDGDGVQELILGQAGFRGYAVRVLTPVAPFPRLEVLAERLVGAVTGLRVVDGAEGPLIVASTYQMPTEQELTRAIDVEPGVVWLALRDGELEVVDAVRAPGGSPAGVSREQVLIDVVDLDGQGEPEVVVAMGQGTWIARRGEPEGVFLPHLITSVVEDLDGDGLPELLGLDPTGRFGVRGIGPDRYPAPQAALPEPSKATDRRVRAVQDLAAIGLRSRAAQTAAAIAPALGDSPSGGALHAEAARQFLAQERPEPAALHAREAQQRIGGLEELVALTAETLVERNPAGGTVVWSPDQPPVEAFQLSRPDAARWVAGRGLVLDVDQTAGEIGAARVTQTGPRPRIAIELVLDRLDPGASIFVGVAQVLPGTLATKHVSSGSEHQANVWFSGPLGPLQGVTRAEGPHRVRGRVSYHPDRAEILHELEVGGEHQAQWFAAPDRPTAVDTFRLFTDTFGLAGLPSVSIWSGTIERVTLWDLALAPPEPSEPPAGGAALSRLAELAARASTGEAVDLGEPITALLTPGREVDLAVALRRHGAPILEELDRRAPERVAQALRAAVEFADDDPRVRPLLRHKITATLAPESDTARSLLLARARLLRREGLVEPARTTLDLLLADAEPSERMNLLVERARIELAAGDREAARTAIARARASTLNPLFWVHRWRLDPDLAPLLKGSGPDGEPAEGAPPRER